MVGMQHRGLVAGDKSPSSPWRLRKRRYKDHLKTGKIKGPPKHAVHGDQDGPFAIELKLMQAGSHTFSLSSTPKPPASSLLLLLWYESF